MFFEIMLRTSFQAAVLALIVLVVTLAFRNRIAAKWRFLLWSLVMLRFLMPLVPTSDFSVFRLFATHQNTTATPTLVPSAPFSQEMTVVSQPTEMPQSKPVHSSQNAASEQVATTAEHDPAFAQHQWNWNVAWPAVAAVVWLLGVCYFLSRIVWGEAVLMFRRARWEKVTSPELLTVIAECSRKTKLFISRGDAKQTKDAKFLFLAFSAVLAALREILSFVGKRNVTVCLTDEKIGAASCGIFRPVILISRDMAETFSPEELRLVLLHEMLHHKRLDPLTHWLSQIARAVHWPNPAVWLLTAKLRTERELAVDESVLRITESNRERDAASSYGNVILKTVRHYAMLNPAPGLLGVQSHDKFLERRITMILKSRKPSWWHLFFGVTLLTGLALTGLTDAKPAGTTVAEEKPDASNAAPVAVETPANTGHGYEIPDGTPEEMLAFCHKIWIGTVPQRGISKNFDEEYKAFVDCRRAILEAANKGLAQNPTGETRKDLIYQKSAALNIIAEREARYKTKLFAEKIRDCEEFVKEVEDRPESPEVVKEVRGRHLEMWYYVFRILDVSRDDFLKWREKVSAFLTNPENDSFIQLLALDVLNIAQNIADRENDRPLAQETADMARDWFLRSKDEFNQSLADRPQAILNKHYVEQDGLKIQGITFEGEKFDVASIKNKVVLVLFWNANSRTFYEIFPPLKAAYEKYHEKGLEIVGVCSYTDPDYRITFDETGKITSNAHQGMPGMRLPSVVLPDYKNRSIPVTEFTPWKINISDKLTVDAGMPSPDKFYDANGDYIFLVDENGKFLIKSFSQNWDSEKEQYHFVTVLDELFQSR